MAFLKRALGRRPHRRELVVLHVASASAAPPDKDSAAAAVESLRDELHMADHALDAIDQKAALVPVVLGGFAGLVAVSDASLGPVLTPVLGVALAVAALSIAVSLSVVWARYSTAGPGAQTTAANTHLSSAHFNRALAGSYADSVDILSELTKWKAHRLNAALALAGVAIVLLTFVRVVGGINMADQPQQPTGSQQTPSTQPESQPASQQPTAQPSQQVEIPTNFGQQILAKGGLPSDLETRINEIEKHG